MINEFLKEKYVSSKSKIIVVDFGGNITETDNNLFEAKTGTHINNIHPFFETITYLLPEKNKEHVFYCVKLEIAAFVGNFNIVFFSGNQTLSAYLIIYDVTDNCKYLQSVAQQKNESVIALELQQLKEKQHINEKEFKNKFLASVSHDLRTPLNAVLGFLEILQETTLNTQQDDIINTIKKSGLHIKSLIDDLLDLSKIEAGQLKIVYMPFSVYELTNHIIKIYEPIMASKKLAFKLNTPQNLPQFLICDKTRLLQILINLIDNAFKFTNKGCVIVNVGSTPLAQNFVELNFSIIDTGIGFPKNKQNSINSFTKFHQTNIDGLGLGLSIVQKLVENMGGKLQINSQLNIGTTVMVSIPMQIANNSTPLFTTKNNIIALTQTHLQVLIADDNEINLMLLKKMLKDYPNLNIQTATNGVEVLEIVQHNFFDLILMDIEMPIMNGWEAIYQLKKHPNTAIKKIPVISITANANETEKYAPAGFCGFVTKPFTKQNLFIELEKVFSTKSNSKIQ